MSDRKAKSISSSTAGQALILAVILGALAAGFVVAYRVFTNQQRRALRFDKIRFSARDTAAAAVEVTNELIKAQVAKGYMTPAGLMYYSLIPAAADPTKRLGWSMNKGFVQTAGKAPVANMDVNICNTTQLERALFDPTFFGNAYKANPVLPVCPNLAANVVFLDGKNGSWVQLGADVNIPLVQNTNRAETSPQWAAVGPAPLSRLEELVDRGTGRTP